MALEVLAASPMLTVQDAGRHGLRHLGVSAAGPIDNEAMALANALCGNPPGTAGLEFAGGGCRVRADRPLRVAVSGGSGCDIRIGARRVAFGESHRLAPGEILSLGAPEGAVWAYLALSGGIATEPVLGSRATHLRSGLGGQQGRRLRAGDRLPLGPGSDGPCLREGAPSPRVGAGPIRLIPGPQADHFSPAILRRLFTEPFTVTPQRDRMAMVLGGVTLPAKGGHDIVSDGTVPGSIQVPGSGQPLVLLAESQTTGGYPKIATVASVDLARLAQMPVGAEVRFEAITRDEGEALWLARRQAFARRLGGLVEKSEGGLSSEYLLASDVVGGIVAPEEIMGTDTAGAGGGA